MHAAASAAERLLGRITRRPRLRITLSLRVWAHAFIATSVWYLLQNDAVRVSSGRWPLLAPWLHSYALPVFALCSLLLALAWGVTGLYLTFPAGFRATLSSVSTLTVRRALPVSSASGADMRSEPEPAALVRRAVEAVPGSRPARYTRAMRTTDPVVVLVALEEVGDRLTSDEVSVYFDRATGQQLATRAERGSTWGD